MPGTLSVEDLLHAVRIAEAEQSISANSDYATGVINKHLCIAHTDLLAIKMTVKAGMTTYFSPGHSLAAAAPAFQ